MSKCGHCEVENLHIGPNGLCNTCISDLESTKQFNNAAAILDKKASEIASFYMQKPDPISFAKVEMYREIAKALRGEDDG